MLFHTGQAAQFGFDPHALVVGVFDHFFGLGDVFFKRQVGTVDHDRRKPAVNDFLADLEIGSMIQMENNGQVLVFHGRLHQFANVDKPRVLLGSCGNLENEGRFFLVTGLHDALDDFHIVDVEGTDGKSFLVGTVEHFLG